MCQHPHLCQFSTVFHRVFCNGHALIPSPFDIIAPSQIIHCNPMDCTMDYKTPTIVLLTNLICIKQYIQADLSIYKRPSTHGVACSLQTPLGWWHLAPVEGMGLC